MYIYIYSVYIIVYIYVYIYIYIYMYIYIYIYIIEEEDLVIYNFSVNMRQTSFELCLRPSSNHVTVVHHNP